MAAVAAYAPWSSGKHIQLTVAQRLVLGTLLLGPRGEGSLSYVAMEPCTSFTLVYNLSRVLLVFIHVHKYLLISVIVH